MFLNFEACRNDIENNFEESCNWFKNNLSLGNASGVNCVEVNKPHKVCNVDILDEESELEYSFRNLNESENHIQQYNHSSVGIENESSASNEKFQNLDNKCVDSNCDLNCIGFVYLKNKLSIPPMSKIAVEVKAVCKDQIGSEENLIIEPLATKFKNGTLVSRSICTKSHGLFISVLNFTDQQVNFNKGTRIGKFLKCKDLTHLNSEDMFCGNASLDPPIATFDHADLSWDSEIDLSHLSPPLKEQMQKFLDENKDVFAASVLDLPGCNTIQHTITLTDDKPVRCKAYRVPQKLKQEMNEQLDILLKANIISPSMSEFASPVILVKKADGSYRLAVDYRKINKKMVKDAYPIPHINDAVDSLAGSQFFSTLDLTSGFFQQVVDPKDRHKTAIITHRGLFHFNRLAFGSSTASSSFQRLMNAVFGDLANLGILVYIDDIVISSKDIVSHLEKLKIVFDRLRQHNLKLKPSKCLFLSNKIKYLGFEIHQGKVAPINKNVDVIQNFKTPNSRKAVRSFLGTVNFYRRFVPDFTKRARHLINLTKDNGRFQWNEQAQAAFEDLKSALISKPCLNLPDFSKEFHLYTDASGEALGAVLSQLDEDNFPHPVAFASRKLKDAETRYSATERELLALVWATAHFKCYLANNHFFIYTDHAPLTYMLKIQDPTSRIAKWVCTLSDFDYSISYIKGKINSVADFLSRFIHNSCNFVNITKQNFCIQTEKENEFIPQNDLLDKIRKLQKVDHKCVKIATRLDRGEVISPKHFKFFFKDDILVAEDTRENPLLRKVKLVVPSEMIPQVFALTHESLAACHMAFQKTIDRIRENFYWAGMSSHVRNLVDSCVSCQQRRAHRSNQLAPLQRMPTPQFPLAKVNVDVIGPLPQTVSGNKYIIAYIDAFSKWPEAYPVSSITSDVVADTLADFISRHGSPSTIVSDRGSNFISAAIEQVYKQFGIKHITTSPYHAAGNGQIERQNKTLANALSHIVNENQLDWDTKLKFALLAMRTSVHSSTTLTPSAVLYGRNLNLPYTIFSQPSKINYNDSPSYCEMVVPELQKIYSKVHEQLIKVSETQEKYREKSAVVKNIKIGDSVWLFSPAIKPGLSKKLSKQNSGPFTVIDKINEVNFKIALEGQLSKSQVVHVDRLSLVKDRLKFLCNESKQAADENETKTVESNEVVSLDSSQRKQQALPTKRKHRLFIPPLPATALRNVASQEKEDTQPLLSKPCVSQETDVTDVTAGSDQSDVTEILDSEEIFDSAAMATASSAKAKQTSKQTKKQLAPGGSARYATRKRKPTGFYRV